LPSDPVPVEVKVLGRGAMPRAAAVPGSVMPPPGAPGVPGPGSEGGAANAVGAKATDAAGAASSIVPTVRTPPMSAGNFTDRRVDSRCLAMIVALPDATSAAG